MNKKYINRTFICVAAFMPLPFEDDGLSLKDIDALIESLSQNPEQKELDTLTASQSTKAPLTRTELLERLHLIRAQLQATATYQELNTFAVTALQQIPHEPSKLSQAKLDFVKGLKPEQVSIQIQYSPPSNSEILSPPESTITPIQTQHAPLVSPASSSQLSINNDAVLSIDDDPNIQIPALLKEQLKNLGIKHIHKDAYQQIIENQHAFTDGIVPKHLPLHFCIELDGQNQILTYVEDAENRPFPLLPKLEQTISIQTTSSKKAIDLNALSTPYAKDIKFYVDSMDKRFEPLLLEILLLGGEAYALLFLKQLDTLKKSNLDFLTRKNAIESFVTPKGMRNLQRLNQFKTPTERQWWESLVTQHLKTEQNTFDFNFYFEAYAFFISQLSDRGLSLPRHCPTTGITHMLTGLTRILDIIALSPDREKQCAEISNLDWGPLGAHFAFTQGFKFVASCMQLSSNTTYPIPTKYTFDELHQLDYTELSTWVYRYAGLNWKPTLDLIKDIQGFVTHIQNSKLDETEKKALLYIFTQCTFSNKGEILSHDLQLALTTSLNTLSTLTQAERSELLKHFVSCQDFHPSPSLTQLTQLISTMVSLKPLAEPFIEKIVSPFTHCLTEFDETILLNLFAQKDKFPTASSILALPQVLQACTKDLQPFTPENRLHFARMLSCLTQRVWTPEEILTLTQSLNDLTSENQRAALLATLAEINVKKSKALPSFEQVIALIHAVKHDHELQAILKDLQKNTDPELVLSALKEKINLFISKKQLLGACILGAGEIEIKSTLVTAIVDFFKSTRAISNQSVTESIKNYIKACVITLAPGQLNLVMEGIPSLKDFLDQFGSLEAYIQETAHPTIEELRKHLENVENALNAFFDDSMTPIPTVQIKGGDILTIVVTGTAPASWYRVQRAAAEISLQKIITKIKEDFPHKLEDFRHEKIEAKLKMSFALSNFTCDEFRQLKTLLQHTKGFLEVKNIPLNQIDQNAHQAILFSQNEINEIKKVIESQKTDTNQAALDALCKKLIDPIVYSDDELERMKKQRLEIRTWIEAFTKSPCHSISILFKKKLSELMQLEIDHALNTLAIDNPDFKAEASKTITSLNTEIPASKGFSDYNESINELVSYINELSKLKKEEPQHFEYYLQTLTSGTLQVLSYKSKTSLLEKLISIQPTLPILTTFKLLLDLIPPFPTGAHANEEALKQAQTEWISNIQRAIERLDQFKLPDALPKDAKESLFQMSFTHNLNQATPFPLDAITHLQALTIDETVKNELLQSLTLVLQKVGPETSSKEIETLLEQTRQLLTLHPQLNPLIIRLLKQIPPQAQKIGTDIKEIEKQLSRHIKAYNQILSTLQTCSQKDKANDTESSTFEIILRILEKIAQNEGADLSLPVLSEIQFQLLESTYFPHLKKSILPLFETPPYPQAQSLLNVLRSRSADKLLQYCDDFDLNPQGKPDEKRNLKEQFATDRIAETLSELHDLKLDKHLSSKEQKELAEQLIWIKALGSSPQFLIRNPENNQETLKSLINCSRDELKTLFKKIYEDLQTSTEPKVKEEKELKLLAILREIFFRTSGNEKGGYFLNTTQIIALLLSLKHPSNNLLMQINTGQGKSLIAPFLAVLQHLKGGTVDMCTANTMLLERDYKQMCKNFFEFLEIKSSIIQKNSRFSDYQEKGINCSTIEDIALYRLTMKQLGKSLPYDSVSLVLDECDYWLLNKGGIIFNLVENQSSVTNPLAWVYPLVRTFIRSPGYKNIGKDAWSPSEDLEKLRDDLNHQATVEQQAQLLKIEDKELNRWIEAACEAERYEIQKQFLLRDKEITKGGKKVNTGKTLIVPINPDNDEPKEEGSFPGGIQQALKARLIEEYKDKKFTIDADAPVLASYTPYDLLSSYTENGRSRIIGISGTPGTSESEIPSLDSQYGVQVFSIPSHEGETRENLPALITHNTHQSFEEIKKIIQKAQKKYNSFEKYYSHAPKPAINPDQLQITSWEEVANENKARREAYVGWANTQTQPMLIITNNIQEALDLEKALKTDPAFSQQFIKQTLEGYPPIKLDLTGFTVQVITGQESYEKRESKIKKSGQPNVITIGTTMLGRGIDFNPEPHHKGFLVISTCIKNKREMRQIAGRCARNGQSGQYQPIFQIAPPTNWFLKILYFLLPWYRSYYDTTHIAKIQKDLTQAETVKRTYIQSIGHAKRIMLKQFDAWEKLLKDIHPQDQKKYDALRSALLHAVNKFQVLSPTAENLDTTIEQFKTKLCQYWETFKKENLVELIESQQDQLSFEQSLTFLCLKETLLAQEINVQAHIHQVSQQIKTATASVTEQDLDFIIQNEAHAILKYNPPQDQAKLNKLKIEHAKQILPILSKKLKVIYPKRKSLKIINTQNDITLALNQMLSDFQTCYTQLQQTSLKQQFQAQGLFLQFFKLCETFNFPLNEHEQASELKQRYTSHVLKQVAEHLKKELAWTQINPMPLHIQIERNQVVKTANALYILADNLINAAEQPDAAKHLYAALQKERLKLQDLFIFSFGHKNTRSLIEETLAAIEALVEIPGCNKTELQQIHDDAIVQQHLEQFYQTFNQQNYLLSQQTEMPQNWKALRAQLTLIRLTPPNPTIFLELQATLERFSEDKKSASIIKPITVLKTQLNHSLSALKKEKISPTPNKTFFAAKAAELSASLQTNTAPPPLVEIKEGHDGIHPYTQVSIQGEHIDKPILKGYVSPLISSLQKRKNQSKADYSAHLSRLNKHTAELKTLLKQNWTDNQTLLAFQDQIKTLLGDHISKHFPFYVHITDDLVFETEPDKHDYIKLKTIHTSTTNALTCCEKQLDEANDQLQHRIIQESFAQDPTKKSFFAKSIQTISAWFSHLTDTQIPLSSSAIQETVTQKKQEIEKLRQKQEEQEKALNAARNKGVPFKSWVEQIDASLQAALQTAFKKEEALLDARINTETEKAKCQVGRFYTRSAFFQFQADVRMNTAGTGQQLKC